MDALLPLRTDQAAARQSAVLQGIVQRLRQAYFDLQEQKLLMRSAFDDTDPQNIDWSQLETVWGSPLVGGGPGVETGKTFWDMVNGTISLMDSSGGNNDFQKLIKRVV